MRKANIQEMFAVAAICCAVSVLQLWWHLFIAKSHSSVATTALLIYTSRDIRNGKGFFPIVDLIIPALLLGAVVGSVGRNWPFRGRVLGVSLVSANVVSLTLTYPMFFSEGALWWVGKRYPSIESLFLSLCEVIVLAAFGCLLGSATFGKKNPE